MPSFFVSDSGCLKSFEEILHFDLEERREKTSYSKNILDPEKKVVVGVTAGASCPNNLIEATILRIFELRGIDSERVMST